MKRAAMFLLSLALSLMICGVSEAGKRQRRCCAPIQYCSTFPCYCLQWPIFDDGTVRTYYAYDTYNPDCPTLETSSYGFSGYQLATPQICDYGDCLVDPNQPTPDIAAQIAPLYVSRPLSLPLITKDKELEDVMSRKAQYKSRDLNGAEHVRNWEPPKAILGRGRSVLIQVPNTAGQPIPIKVFYGQLHFRAAAQHAGIPDEEVLRKHHGRWPQKENLIFGVEIDPNGVNVPGLPPAASTAPIMTPSGVAHFTETVTLRRQEQDPAFPATSGPITIITRSPVR